MLCAPLKLVVACLACTEPLSLYLYAETGTIAHVDLNLAGKTIAVVFNSMASANVTSWGFSKLRLQVDKTSAARPGTNFVVVSGSGDKQAASALLLPLVSSHGFSGLRCVWN